MAKQIRIEPIDGNVVYLFNGDTTAVITRKHAQEFAKWVHSRGVAVEVIGNAIDEFRAERDLAAAEDKGVNNG
jgi:hypothetical protein